MPEKKSKPEASSTTAPVSYFNVKMGSERNFGLVFSVILSIVGVWPLAMTEGSVRWWALVVAAILFVIALLIPRVLKPLNYAWFRFGLLLGRIIAPIVMMGVFFIAVTPTGVIMRLFGKDLLSLKRPAGDVKSFWKIRSEQDHSMNSMNNQF